MLGNALLLALRQIFRNPMRSILTVLGLGDTNRRYQSGSAFAHIHSSRRGKR